MIISSLSWSGLHERLPNFKNINASPITKVGGSRQRGTMKRDLVWGGRTTKKTSDSDHASFLFTSGRLWDYTEGDKRRQGNKLYAILQLSIHVQFRRSFIKITSPRCALNTAGKECVCWNFAYASQASVRGSEQDKQTLHHQSVYGDVYSRRKARFRPESDSQKITTTTGLKVSKIDLDLDLDLDLSNIWRMSVMLSISTVLQERLISNLSGDAKQNAGVQCGVLRNRLEHFPGSSTMGYMENGTRTKPVLLACRATLT